MVLDLIVAMAACFCVWLGRIAVVLPNRRDREYCNFGAMGRCWNLPVTLFRIATRSLATCFWSTLGRLVRFVLICISSVNGGKYDVLRHAARVHQHSVAD
jgi:hypothetical protein